MPPPENESAIRRSSSMMRPPALGSISRSSAPVSGTFCGVLCTPPQPATAERIRKTNTPYPRIVRSRTADDDFGYRIEVTGTSSARRRKSIFRLSAAGLRKRSPSPSSGDRRARRAPAARRGALPPRVRGPRLPPPAPGSARASRCAFSRRSPGRRLSSVRREAWRAPSPPRTSSAPPRIRPFDRARRLLHHMADREQGFLVERTADQLQPKRQRERVETGRHCDARQTGHVHRHGEYVVQIHLDRIAA